ncbi:S9 family peptidase [Flavimobilis sp. GY10621]|uniref:S9 family peptidase n=1 Tax=Flavimobilis rhizosphaerae TaxID=2775421 RepID=A0ABR9DQA5_9MICO|nr:alpha/beta fold hydrolase [Flavimobilis rhizosphaerae]MBD9699305.1 S9 family peptidase [Flavimobilis rhizosphaerae]
MTSDAPSTPFEHLDDVVALPRLSGLALSPDGRRLVTGVATLHPDGDRYVTSLWEVDARGEAAPRRLTRGAKGESQPAFTPDGDLLFVATRPGGDDDEKARLWLLPAGGGEARTLASHPGGIDGVSVARGSGTVLVGASAHVRSSDVADDAARRKVRDDAKVTAILHDGYPIRFWDHDLGPSMPRIYALDGSAAETPAADPSGTSGTDASGADVPAPHPATVVDDLAPAVLRDLTPDAGPALDGAAWDLAPDGTWLVTEWVRPEGRANLGTGLVRVDIATGERTDLLVPDATHDHHAPRVSPDGAHLVWVRSERSTPHAGPRDELWLLELATGAQRRLGADWDGWPGQVVWLPDGSGLVMTADWQGRGPVFRVDVTTGTVVRLTDEGVFTDVVVAPDGSAVFALRSSWEHPAEPVRIALDVTEGGFAQVTDLRGPAQRPALPGTLTEVTTTATDGTPLRAWLALPDGASADAQAPLVLWIHGGPLGSWNAWSWRWNPWLLVSQGWAVLMPDPALSKGYGQAMVDRGWGRWGAEPFTDLLALTDAAEARADVDETRTAAMGGSFGGYMANWVAGHTDRFRAIVSHAGLWSLELFLPTTDHASYWAREMTPEMRAAWSPHRSVGEIRTPMLVVHGDKDYRVPVGEGLSLWYSLLSASGLPQADDGTTAHRFLYFPDENHWILKPQHAKVWYATVRGFLAEHVLDEAPADPPATLG